MSYRHSSYRKVKKAVQGQESSGYWTPTGAQRIAHWVGLPKPPRTPGWGKPKAKHSA